MVFESLEFLLKVLDFARKLPFPNLGSLLSDNDHLTPPIEQAGLPIYLLERFLKYSTLHFNYSISIYKVNKY